MLTFISSNVLSNEKSFDRLGEIKEKLEIRLKRRIEYADLFPYFERARLGEMLLLNYFANTWSKVREGEVYKGSLLDHIAQKLGVKLGPEQHSKEFHQDHGFLPEDPHNELETAAFEELWGEVFRVHCQRVQVSLPAA